MLKHNFVEGRNIRFATRLAHGDSGKLAGFAQQLVDEPVDLIAVVGTVAARAARSITSLMPIVYAVVVDPVGDGLATSSGDPFPNMTGVTTFDPGQAQAQLALVQSIKPDLETITYLADAAVSDCLANANLRVAHDAGLRATVLRIVGPAPDLEEAFGKIQRHGAHAIIALEHPAIGANAARIAEGAMALNIPSIFARDQAGAGGLFYYGTSLGQAAHFMAQQVSRVLGGDAPADIPIQTLSSPELVLDMRAAHRLGLTIPPDVLRNAVQVN
jgi:putative ABC transport system substrate-binding protein